MKRSKGMAMFAAVVVALVVSLFLLGGCGHNPVSSNPNNGSISGSGGGNTDGKGTKQGNIGASADPAAAPASNR